MFNSLGQRCFQRCVHQFRSRQLDSGERQCIATCSDKWMQHMQRVGQRFAEETMPGTQPQGGPSPASAPTMGGGGAGQ